jgi:hypothetical protein
VNTEIEGNVNQNDLKQAAFTKTNSIAASCAHNSNFESKLFNSHIGRNKLLKIIIIILHIIDLTQKHQSNRFIVELIAYIYLVLISRILNKQEIPCTTEATSTFFGCTGSNSRFLGFFFISMKFLIDRVPSCLIFGIWDFGRIREHGNVPLNFPRAKTFQTSPHMFNLRQRNSSYTSKGVFFLVRVLVKARFPDF